MEKTVREANFVVVGGGIAGVSCTETLAFLEPEKSIILLSESSLIKTIANLKVITRTLFDFDVEEKKSTSLSEKYPNVFVIHDVLTEIDEINHHIQTGSGIVVKYGYLCLCTGAAPKLIPQANNFDEILGLRDTDSVENFQKKLKNCKKIVVVGNGGIASELIYKLNNVEIDWVVKDKHISATFVDPGASEFFQSSLNQNIEPQFESKTIYKRLRYSEESPNKSGAALGPDWYKNLTICGTNDKKSIKIHYESEISNVKKINKPANFPIEVILNNSIIIPCNLIISATGVTPKLNFTTKSNLKLSEDGGILVDQFMQTSLPDVFACGDVCTANWTLAKHWFQMKLWTQARQMGCYAAKSISGRSRNEEVLQDFCFEIFAHSTKLFGYKVILLGLFNGQKLGSNYEILVRVTEGLEYVKFVLENNKLQGAVLIGDTDLEEMCENLILNQLDLSPYGDDILNPNIDIEDYFD